MCKVVVVVVVLLCGAQQSHKSYRFHFDAIHFLSFRRHVTVRCFRRRRRRRGRSLILKLHRHRFNNKRCGATLMARMLSLSAQLSTKHKFTISRSLCVPFTNSQMHSNCPLDDVDIHIDGRAQNAHTGIWGYHIYSAQHLKT